MRNRCIFLLLLLSLVGVVHRGHAQTQAVPVRVVAGSGFTVAALHSGGRAFSNRKYTWGNLPAGMDGVEYTELAGGGQATITVRALQDGLVCIATTAPFAAPGWQRIEGLELPFDAKGGSLLCVYGMACQAGAVVTIPQNAWSGTLVLAPLIELAPLPATGQPPGVVIDYSPASTGIFVGSPSLAVLPDGTYVASHDLFGPRTSGDHTRFFQSHDRGVTWQMVSEVVGQAWSTLFVHGGALYIMGTLREWGPAVIRRSDDGGRTWTNPDSETSGKLADDMLYATGPTPVVEFGGRIWRSMEAKPKGEKGRDFRALVMSAPDDADLLDARNWTETNKLTYDRGWPGGSWLEGNVVVTPRGEVVDVLRTELRRGDRAAMVHISADGSTASFDVNHDLFDFPGGGTKFTIRYDTVSKRYWSLVNKQKDPSAERNILVLTSSADLWHWKVERLIFQDRDEKYVAWQYVDWQFEGDDIIAVSRTSYDGANTYHNANHLTFHRIVGFRGL